MKTLPELSHVVAEIGAKHGLRDPQFKGGGAFKETFRVLDSADQPWALKVFDPQKCDKVRSDREIAAMQRCNSPRIGELISVGDIASIDGRKYLFTLEEYLDGGTLADRLSQGNLKSSDVFRFGLALTDALHHLSLLKLVHRDIKPENIMFRLSDPDPVLIDLGIVRDLTETSATVSSLPRGPGTPYYAAPEQLNNEKALISCKTDQFSLGVVLGICLTGRHPYERTGMSVVDVVLAVERRMPCSSEFSAAMHKTGCEFILKMLSPWPVSRYASPDVLRSNFQARI